MLSADDTNFLHIRWTNDGSQSYQMDKGWQPIKFCTYQMDKGWQPIISDGQRMAANQIFYISDGQRMAANQGIRATKGFSRANFGKLKF